MEKRDLILYLNEAIFKQDNFFRPIYQTLSESLKNTKFSDQELQFKTVIPLPNASNASSIEVLRRSGSVYGNFSGYESEIEIRFFPKSNNPGDFYSQLKDYYLSIYLFLDAFSPDSIKKNINRGGISTICNIVYDNNIDRCSIQLMMNWSNFTIYARGKREPLTLSLRKRMKAFDNLSFQINLDEKKFLNDLLKEEREKEEKAKEEKRQKQQQKQQENNQEQQKQQENKEQKKSQYQKTNEEYNFDENFYLYLQVKENASKDEIRKAYLVAIKKYHGDLNHDDPNATYYASKINNAYETLYDDSNRKKYDEYLAKVRSHSKSR